jgi:DNA-binding Lrp family transcriptional regulator
MYGWIVSVAVRAPDIQMMYELLDEMSATALSFGRMVPTEPANRRPAGRSAAVVDDVDRRLLKELTMDGRISMAALALRAHISRANCYARLDRLQREGIITGYTAVVDHRRVDIGISAHVYLKVRQHSWKKLRQALKQVPEIQNGALISGENDLVLFVRTSDADSLRDLVLDRLQAIDEVLSTHTVIVFDEL